MTPTLAPRTDLRTLDQILDEIRGPIALALALDRTDHVALIFRAHAAEIEAAYIAEHDLYPWRDGPITPTQPAGLSVVEISGSVDGPDPECTSCGSAHCAECDAVPAGQPRQRIPDGEPETTPIPIRPKAEVA